jgi:hypothetical protein
VGRTGRTGPPLSPDPQIVIHQRRARTKLRIAHLDFAGVETGAVLQQIE